MSKKLIFGIRGAVPDNVEETRQIPWVLSDYSRDRYGTVLNQSNWKLDNFRKNPVVGYQHNLYGGMCSDPDPDFIIGKDVCENMLTGSGEELRLVGITEFEPREINEVADKIFRKVLFGSISRTSVGFLEFGTGKYGDGDEMQYGANETYYFEGQELLEYSVVNIPGNPNAGLRNGTAGDVKTLMRKMREESYGALMYAWKELGGKFRLSQIEEMSVRDILDLLDGKDVELKQTDVEKVRKLLAENAALRDQNARLTELLKKRRGSR